MPELNSCEFRVSYIRDSLVEEYHDGVLVFSDSETNFNSPYYLRSCAKPLQLSLIFDCKLNLTPQEIAFCSGSHAGEECHVNIAYNLLNKFNLSENMLKCGIHAPLSRSMQDRMLINGEKYNQIHNNCSGKHIAFLAICKDNGWDSDNYYESVHPLQAAVKNRIYELCEVYEDYPSTTDGCGVPIVSMPLKNLAIGFVNLNKKYPQIVSAIMQHPYIFGGENRLDTEIIQSTEGLMAKVGAGGLCVVLNTKLNKAFAVKMYDASMEARRIAVFDIINTLGWGNIKYDNTIRTINGKVVGNIINKFHS